MPANQRETVTNSAAFAVGFWRTAACCLGIAFSTGVIYANSLAVPFIFDDANSIVRNSTIRSLRNLKQALSPPSDGETVQCRPLLNLSFAANYAWTGLDVWSWHVVNIAIHALAGICLFGVVRQTLQLPTISVLKRPRAASLAFAVALLWTVHPLNTESVTYVVQRAESLAGLFLLLTLYCSIRGLQDRGCVWQVTAVLTCLAGMATKEVMAVAPLLILLFDWAFQGDSLTTTFKKRWRFYIPLASTWLMLAALIGASAGRGSSAGFGRGVTSWEYLRTQFTWILLYLKLAIWPHPLVLDYGDWIATDSTEIIAAGTLVVLLLGATLAALIHKRTRRLGFLGVWSFCTLAPSSSVVPIVSQTGAEHRMYLPLASVVVLLVVVVDRFCDGARTHASERRRQVATWAVFCSVALALGTLTWHRNADYKTALSIWRDTAEKRPENWRAQASLAGAYVDVGEAPMALATFNKLIQLAPNRSPSFNDRGALHLRLRHLDEAISDFHRALAINPANASAQLNLGIAFTAAGRLEPALAAFDEASRIDPESPYVYWRRGLALGMAGRFEDSIRDCSTAIRLRPKMIPAYHARALSYVSLGRFDLARADLLELQRLGAAPDSQLLERIEKAGATAVTPPQP